MTSPKPVIVPEAGVPEVDQAGPEPIACPVEAELFGIPLGTCGQPITHEVTFRCDGGCEREPRRVCEFHALLLSKDDPAAYCGQCTENRIHPAGARLLDVAQGGEG